MHDRDSAGDPGSGSVGVAPTNPIHVVPGTATKTDRHDALRALHQDLAQAERHMHDILHPHPKPV